eukprot:4966896-Pyramimonas_sp.AAC.1
MAAHGFTEVVFADNLKAVKDFDASIQIDHIMHALRLCRDNLHNWGLARGGLRLRQSPRKLDLQ